MSSTAESRLNERASPRLGPTVWLAALLAAAASGAAAAGFGDRRTALIAGLLLAVALVASIPRERLGWAKRKRAHQELIEAQKMEAIGNLTGGLAHDFNNLFGIIIGNLDLLREPHTGAAEAEELSRDALQAALRGAELTRSLLAFARRQPLQPRQVDSKALISKIADILRPSLGGRIDIVLELAERLPPALADPVQLEAALVQLVSNARDAMPAGGRLRIAAAERRLGENEGVARGDYLTIEVSDTGTGIAPDMLDRIFEPFFTTKERGCGGGLGLSMVFGFAKQSGGALGVDSAVGRGTTFRLSLPEARGAVERSARPEAMQPRRGKGEIVLVVEDDASMRRVAVRQVAELGYSVREAENAAAAVALIEREPAIDLLFTDIVMPGAMDGIALARLVAERWPKIKIVLTSGFPRSRTGGDSGIAANAPLLSKPYRKEDLAQMLRDTLDHPHGAAAQHQD